MSKKQTSVSGAGRSPASRNADEFKRVRVLLVSDASLSRLVTVFLQETSEEWGTAKVYQSMETN